MPAQHPTKTLAPYCAFRGQTLIADGTLLDVALQCRQQDGPELLHIFDTATGRVVDVDLRGEPAEVTAWVQKYYPDRLTGDDKQALAQKGRKGRGRPKLGVVSREITLLPRQWEWLGNQPGGASVTLRRLVDLAAKDPAAQRQLAQQALDRFATTLAGDEPGFEEAMRALWADDADGFAQHSAQWPPDVREQAVLMSRALFSQ